MTARVHARTCPARTARGRIDDKVSGHARLAGWEQRQSAVGRTRRRSLAPSVRRSAGLTRRTAASASATVRILCDHRVPISAPLRERRPGGWVTRACERNRTCSRFDGARDRFRRRAGIRHDLLRSGAPRPTVNTGGSRENERDMVGDAISSTRATWRRTRRHSVSCLHSSPDTWARWGDVAEASVQSAVNGKPRTCALAGCAGARRRSRRRHGPRVGSLSALSPRRGSMGRRCWRRTARPSTALATRLAERPSAPTSASGAGERLQSRNASRSWAGPPSWPANGRRSGAHARQPKRYALTPGPSPLGPRCPRSITRWPASDRSAAQGGAAGGERVRRA